MKKAIIKLKKLSPCLSREAWAKLESYATPEEVWANWEKGSDMLYVLALKPGRKKRPYVQVALEIAESVAHLDPTPEGAHCRALVRAYLSGKRITMTELNNAAEAAMAAWASGAAGAAGAARASGASGASGAAGAAAWAAAWETGEAQEKINADIVRKHFTCPKL